MTYWLDFCKKVLTIKEKEQLSFARAAKRFDVSLASVVRWSRNIIPQKTWNKPATKISMEALQDDIRAYPDAYQYKRTQRLGVIKDCTWHALKRLKVTYKKNFHSPQGGSRKTLCFLSDHSTVSR